MNAVKLPGMYAKFITAALGQALVYLYTYGWAWHIKEAALMAAVALGVLGISNTPKPAAVPAPGIPFGIGETDTTITQTPPAT